ncbi:MAG TPA: hypothetical protein VL728_20765 [Cyclobacteriaceae bacterium]|nr:hypothetical protein [Cyclobacteriaceae bacterium]
MSSAPVDQTLSCENCGNLHSAAQKFCSKCSFPINGTEEEKIQFKNKIRGHQFLKEEAEKELKKPRVIILVLAGVVLLSGLYQGFANDDFATMIVNLCMSLLYLILAAWCSKNPFGAILTALLVYITVNVINAFVDPLSLFQGIILKIIFIGALVKGIRSARDAQEHLVQLQKMNASVENN